jgi:sensor domain CHASE-containing protein
VNLSVGLLLWTVMTLASIVAMVGLVVWFVRRSRRDRQLREQMLEVQARLDRLERRGQ